jgi:hypothetical protein
MVMAEREKDWKDMHRINVAFHLPPPPFTMSLFMAIISEEFSF